jgi:hypothetical protein
MGPRLAALVLGVLVLGGAIGPAHAQAPTPELSFRIHFDQRGELEAASRPVGAAIKTAASQVTDAFVFSRGWNNDPVTAERTYREFIDGMIAATPTARLPAGFKRLLVGIYWPSALFPVSNCLQPVGDRSQVHGWAQAAFPLVASRPGSSRR